MGGRRGEKKKVGRWVPPIYTPPTPIYNEGREKGKGGKVKRGKKKGEVRSYQFESYILYPEKEGKKRRKKDLFTFFPLGKEGGGEGIERKKKRKEPGETSLNELLPSVRGKERKEEKLPRTRCLFC